MKNIIFQNTGFIIKGNIWIFQCLKIAMSVYIFLNLSENATLDVIVFLYSKILKFGILK